MLSRRIRSTLVVAALVASGVTLGAGPAAAQGCTSIAGVGRTVVNGVPRYYEDSRCGTLNRDGSIPVTVKPRPTTSGTAGGCRTYPNGQLCGEGIGQPRPAISTSAWQRLYGSSVGTVTVGPITTVSGSSGGSGGRSGTVSVGSVQQIKDDDSETSAE